MGIVALIIDEMFGEKIFNLVKDHHAWIIKSEKNSGALEKLVKMDWFLSYDPHNYDVLGPGFSTFNKGDSLDIYDLFSNIIFEILDHHDGYITTKWTEIKVFGLELNDQVIEILHDNDIVVFIEENDHFICFPSEEL
ncbi:hypothetical protein KKF34_02800 [Myxococcota bacterium]|nr:hypothetical protein [Myxococcota bacterium]MBU1383026.1 hypothetical protein [Myxococcota bacterium]MBU1495791.1 hypothetical protein [Myxococcota bacterium]